MVKQRGYQIVEEYEVRGQRHRHSLQVQGSQLFHLG
jgi:hypothetical protein